MRKCKDCSESKVLTDFVKYKRNGETKYLYRCKKCEIIKRRPKQRAWLAANREKHNKRSRDAKRKRYQADPVFREHLKEESRLDYAATAVVVLERRREEYAANAEAICVKAQKRYAENPELRAKKQAANRANIERHKTDPEYAATRARINAENRKKPKLTGYRFNSTSTAVEKEDWEDEEILRAISAE